MVEVNKTVKYAGSHNKPRGLKCKFATTYMITALTRRHKMEVLVCSLDKIANDFVELDKVTHYRSHFTLTFLKKKISPEIDSMQN